MEFQKAKKNLSSLWFILSGIIGFLMIIQTISDKYGSFTSEVWNWLLPSIIPTLSLIMSIFIIDIKGKQSNRQIDSFYFKLSFSLSLLYLLTILLMIITISESKEGINKINFLKDSNIFLGPFQGLVNASMGFFFFKKS